MKYGYLMTRDIPQFIKDDSVEKPDSLLNE